ncbi:DUF4190 domain-containing protein [Actinomadura sp. NEAU-AAG5]|uniref:DUF4190 domain-containing protein n=2 Tax=Actinomadura litoris TaxID=2678616 RepID=A0A7K1L6Z1_9ACTN|nr:DUF4190 domain-containing protein [Actinomadura litoris]
MSMPPNTDNVSERPEPPADWALPGEPSPPSSGPAGPPPPPGPAGPPPPPFPGFPGPDPGAPRRRDPLAIVALATGLCGLALFGIGFGIAALVRIRRHGDKGRGLAIGGIVASLTWVVVVVVVVAVMVGSLFSPDRDEAGHIRGSGKVLVGTLRVGDCFTGVDNSGRDRLVTALPCTRPHDAEIVAEARLADGPYPGAREANLQASEVCRKNLRALLKSRFAQELDLYAIQPDGAAWKRGERDVLCAYRYTGRGSLTTPLAQTVDQALRPLGEFVLGDCFGKVGDRTTNLRARSCARPHWTEVYWVQNLPAGRYPGEKAVEDRAEKLCDRRAKQAFSPRHSPDQILWLYPEAAHWSTDIRQVACLGATVGKPTKGSFLRK